MLMMLSLLPVTELLLLSLMLSRLCLLPRYLLSRQHLLLLTQSLPSHLEQLVVWLEKQIERARKYPARADRVE